MRKILTGCIIATAITSVYPAAAQIFSYSYTDTNQLAKTLKPATQSSDESPNDFYQNH
ncbi:TPA: hypothetical protein ACF23E_003739 [Escherichia coli]